MKTFFDLKQEVIARGLCHGCGGCVTFCTAINYGALKMEEDHVPRYRSVEKCIDCGLCYLICPAVGELDEQVNRNVGWSAPMGRILQVSVARATDKNIRDRATDGGAVTSLLLHLFDSGRIDGAIVSKQTHEGRQPWLATSRDDIIAAAGSHFDAMQGVLQLGEKYSTYSPSAQALGSLMSQGLRKIAFVGTPCQIKSVRKMQALKLVPSNAIKFYFGLFCTSNFDLDDDKTHTLEEMAGCTMADVEKINIKEDFMLNLKDGRQITIPLQDLDFARRDACRFCDDFSAEYADLSFGGLGADHGWTAVVVRSALGRAAFADAREKSLEIQSIDDHPGIDAGLITAIMQSSKNKKKNAGNMTK
ncbi:Coenzyme F420 hydrogenase/dehydrogenase, beta subunit C-terminal domain [Desulfopila inferna]|uniref:Coenzyme F420 hydrogenase/dehydrogenase, beta subunit C-terminal domain n=1 Tax=Desulfopila inferna TaxID=468528 RepID=UPI00196246FD|nr:Coenzyme F420 hydrogenase/dehydrogenase, beta subunit C-terminal domain [Desulfopila inferna]MBM9604883.1 Coenzyme F420 hydrogenase/dehydrogenase, beta subunit C-terminal domain [Desulfopila inferna]